MAKNPIESVPVDLWSHTFSFLNPQDVARAACVSRRLNQAKAGYLGHRNFCIEMIMLVHQYGDLLGLSKDITNVLFQENKIENLHEKSTSELKASVIQLLANEELQTIQEALTTEQSNEAGVVNAQKTQEEKRLARCAVQILKYLMAGKPERAYEHFRLLYIDDFDPVLAGEYILPWVVAFGHTKIVDDIFTSLSKKLSTLDSVTRFSAIKRVAKNNVLEIACRFGRDNVMTPLIDFYPGWCGVNQKTGELSLLESLFATDNPLLMERLVPTLLSFNIGLTTDLLFEAFKRGRPRMASALMKLGCDPWAILKKDGLIEKSMFAHVLILPEVGLRVVAYQAIYDVYRDHLVQCDTGFYLIHLAMSAGLLDEVKRLIPLYRNHDIDVTFRVREENTLRLSNLNLGEFIYDLSISRALYFSVLSGNVYLVEYMMDPLGFRRAQQLDPEAVFDEREQRERCGFVFPDGEMLETLWLYGRLAVSTIKGIKPADSTVLTDYVSMLVKLYSRGIIKLTEKYNLHRYSFSIPERFFSSLMSANNSNALFRCLFAEIVDQLKATILVHVNAYLEDNPVPGVDHAQNKKPKVSQGVLWARDLKAKLEVATNVLEVIEIVRLHLSRRKRLKTAGLTPQSLDYNIVMDLKSETIMARLLPNLLYAFGETIGDQHAISMQKNFFHDSVLLPRYALKKLLNLFSARNKETGLLNNVLLRSDFLAQELSEEIDDKDIPSGPPM